MLASERRADGNAVVNTLQQLSGALGTSVVTSIVNASQAGASSADMATATMAGSRSAYLLLAALMVVPLVCQLIVFARKRAR